MPVIAITRFAESDLSVMADYKLWVASSEYLVRSAAMTSRLAQLHVIDILYSAYIKLDYENNIERIEKTQMKKCVPDGAGAGKWRLKWNEFRRINDRTEK